MPVSNENEKRKKNVITSLRGSSLGARFAAMFPHLSSPASFRALHFTRDCALFSPFLAHNNPQSFHFAARSAEGCAGPVLGKSNIPVKVILLAGPKEKKQHQQQDDNNLSGSRLLFFSLSMLRLCCNELQIYGQCMAPGLLLRVLWFSFRHRRRPLSMRTGRAITSGC